MLNEFGALTVHEGAKKAAAAAKRSAAAATSAARGGKCKSRKSKAGTSTAKVVKDNDDSNDLDDVSEESDYSDAEDDGRGVLKPLLSMSALHQVNYVTPTEHERPAPNELCNRGYYVSRELPSRGV